MAQTKIKEIRDLTKDELQKRLRDLREESLNLRMQQATAQLENTSRLRLVRREVARVQTVLNELQRSEQAG